MALIEVCLPTLHPGQVAAYRKPGRFKAIRCGRRWGKTVYGSTVACDGAVKGEPVGWFAPDYKRLGEAMNDMFATLAPVKISGSKNERIIRTRTGGQIEFWTLEDDNAGRSRRYKKIIIDEGAFAKANMMEIWERSIKPTLFDFSGSATVLSNTNGADPDNFFWRICNEPEHGFGDYHAPTGDNPLLPLRMAGETEEAHAARRLIELEKLRTDNPPLVYAQEYLAQFVDWSGVAFFDREALLVGGQAVPVPTNCDGVFAIIDSAMKTGTDNDGTAVSYWALTKHAAYPLVCLDWGIVQIEGSLLETWIPSVFAELEAMARQCGARAGSMGAWIEDANSGTILLQQAPRNGWPAQAIESKLTALGKDGRALNASSYVYRKQVKISRPAFDRTVIYKGASRNHFMTQVLGFRMGDKKASTRADDLLDTFCYAVALALGNAGGF